MGDGGGVVTLRSLAALDVHKTGGFPAGYPRNLRTFYVPVDDVHGCLLDLLRSCTRSLTVAMYALDDRELADRVRALCADPKIPVQITLDASQAANVHEAALLAAEQYPATSIAIGNSEHGSLMHLKDVVVDGLFVATGSTNWSTSGQFAQDNALTVVRNAVLAAEVTARIGAIHQHILAAQKAGGVIA